MLNLKKYAKATDDKTNQTMPSESSNQVNCGKVKSLELKNNKLNIAESTRLTEQMKRSIMHCHIIMAGDNLLVICWDFKGENTMQKKKPLPKKDNKQLVTRMLRNTACGTL